MSLLEDPGVDTSTVPSGLPPSLLELLSLADTPLERAADAVTASDLLQTGSSSGLQQPAPEISGLTILEHASPAIALVDDNLPPLIASAFSTDNLLAFNASPAGMNWIRDVDSLPLQSSRAFAQPAQLPPPTIQLSEDEPFTVLLADLFPSDAILQSLSLTGPSWVTANLVEGDSSIAGRLIVQTQLRDAAGRRLRSADLSALTSGAELSLSVEVSDTRRNGQGVIGLQGSLNWNPQAATVLAIDLQDTLPLFRRSGDSSDWADGNTQLVAAALPRAGAGEALGDTAQERFAQISFRLRDPSQPLRLSFTPELYPAIGSGTIRSDQLLNLGVDPVRLPLLQGTPLPDFSGTVAVGLQATFADGGRWQQSLTLQIAARNDAPSASQRTVQLPAVDEDSVDPPGQSVAALFDPVFMDVDPGDGLAGVAITHLPDTSGRGVWQMRSGVQGWQTLSPSLAISEREALLLHREDRLRFLPAPDWSSDQPVPSLQLRLLDRSQPVLSGSRLDLSRTLSADLSQAAFSRESIQLTTQVRPVNDGPEPGPMTLPVLRARQGKPFIAELPDGAFLDRDLGRNPSERLRYSLGSADPSRPLPAWLQIDPLSGRLSGVPTAVTGETLRLQLIATDQAGARASRPLDLIVRPVDPNNTPPRAIPDQRLELLEYEQRSIHLADIFQDQDPGDVLTFEAVIPAQHADWIRFDALNQQLLLQPGSTDITAEATEPVVVLKGIDRDGEEAIHHLRLAVRNTNQAPQSLRPDQPSLLRLDQDAPLSLDLKALFDDPDLPYGDRLRFLVAGSDRQPIGAGSLAWLTLGDDGVLRGVPGNAQVGTLDLTLTAVDRSGLTAEQSLRVVVDNVNDAPYLTSRALPLIGIDEGSTWRLDLHDWFEDPDTIHDQQLSFEISSRGALPRWLRWDPAAATLYGTPTANDLGDVILTLRATDGLAIRSHALRLQVLNVNEAPVVARPLSNLNVPEDERLLLNLTGVFTDPDPGDLLRYTLVARDASGEPIPEAELGWLQIRTSADNQVERSNRLVINPVVRSALDGHQLSAEELSQLGNGSEFDVEIQIEDNRQDVVQPGLIGADLSLLWNPAVLAPVHTSADTLQAGLTPLLPVFPRVDTTLLSRGRIGLSAASAPALGLGAVIGDQPAERFATVRMKLLNSSFPIVLALEVNSEQDGGLGLGWQEADVQESRVVLASFSSSNRLELEVAPGNDEVGDYTVALVATDAGNLSTATTFQLLIPNRNDAPSSSPLIVTPLRDNTVSRFDLSSYFSDVDAIHGDRLVFTLASSDQAGWAQITTGPAGAGHQPTATLEVSVPGLRQPERHRVLITATDSAGASVSQDVLLQANPRPQAPPLERLDPQRLASAERGRPIRLAESLHLNTNLVVDANDQSALILRLPEPIQPIVRAPSTLATVEQQREWQSLFLRNLTSSSDKGVTRWQLNLSELSTSAGIPIGEIIRLLELRPPSADLSYASAGPRGSLAMPLSLAMETVVSGDDGSLYGVDRSSWGPDWIELIVTPAVNPLLDQRLALQNLESLAPMQRSQLNRQLSDLLQSSSLQSALPFQPIAKAVGSFLSENTSSTSTLSHQDILLILDWFDQPSAYEDVFAVNRVDGRYYETVGRSASARLSPALGQSEFILQTVARQTTQRYQTSIGAISFDTAVNPAQGFKVVTFSLPQDYPVNSLLKSTERDGKTTVAPLSVRELNLTSLKRFARSADMDAADYRALLDDNLNRFELRDYQVSRSLGSVDIRSSTGSTLLQSLIQAVPADRVDGSAILVDVDGDGINDLARMLLLDNGFWDTNPSMGTIEDPLYLTQLTTLTEPSQSGGGGQPSAFGNSAGRSPGAGALILDPRDDLVPLSSLFPPAPQAPFLVSPSRGDASSQGRSLPQSAVLSADGSAQAPGQSRPDRSPTQVSPAGQPSGLGLDGPPVDPGARGSASSRLPSLAQMWSDLKSTLEDHAVEVMSLAAALGPWLGRLGLELFRSARPFRLRLRHSSPLDSSSAARLLFLVEASEGGTGPGYLVDRFGDNVRITRLQTPHAAFHPATRVIAPERCWLWQLVMQTSQPGLLVRACRMALRAVEVGGLSRSGLDYNAWTRDLLALHHPQPPATPRLQSDEEFIVQALACLAHLGFPYHSISR